MCLQSYYAFVKFDNEWSCFENLLGKLAWVILFISIMFSAMMVRANVSCWLTVSCSLTSLSDYKDHHAASPFSFTHAWSWQCQGANSCEVTKTVLFRGRPFPLRPWCIPLFQIYPLFSKKCQTLWKILKNLPFPENCLDFHPPKFLMTFFFSHPPQISNFPLLSLYISFPVSQKLLFPLLWKIPPVLEKFSCFLHTLCVFRPPLLWPWCIYASRNARIGRPWFCSCIFFKLLLLLQ